MKPFLYGLLLTLGISGCSRQRAPEVTFVLASGEYPVVVKGEGELEASNAQVLSAPPVWPAPTLSYLIPEGTVVEKGEVIARLTASQIETEYLMAQEDLDVQRANYVVKNAELNQQLLQYETQMTTANASAEAARLQAAKLDFEAPRTREIKRLEISQFELEAERARKNLESLKKIQTEERANAQMRIRQAENNLARAKAQLDQLTLTAPYRGIVIHGINPRTQEKVKQGETVFPRMPVAQLPDLSSMQVNLKISETDAQRLAAGMTARITIPSLGSALFPGRVARIDRVAKPIQRDSKVKRVEVIVQIDTSAAEIRPGLTAAVQIAVRNLRDVLAVPHECLFERDSVKVVYVQRDRKYEARPVAVLFQDEDFAALYGDLALGDRLAMSDPGQENVIAPKKLAVPAVPATLDTFRIRRRSEGSPNGASPAPAGVEAPLRPENRRGDGAPPFQRPQ